MLLKVLIEYLVYSFDLLKPFNIGLLLLNIAGAIIFLLTATIVFVNFVTDIILAIIDPRIRKGVMGGS